jgi:hypothetical protein
MGNGEHVYDIGKIARRKDQDVVWWIILRWVLQR